MKKLLGILVLGLMFCNTVQALPECEGEDDTQWTNCQGTYLKKEIGPGSTRDYTGEFGSVPGKRHGKGSSQIYKDGNPWDGLQLWWYTSSGLKSSVKTYKDGELISEKCWDKDGSERDCN